MSASPSRTPSSTVRLFRGAGVAVALVGLFLIGLMLLTAGVDRGSPLLIAIGALFSLGALIQGIRLAARSERRRVAEWADPVFADHLVCERCGVFPRESGIARPQSRLHAAVHFAVGIAVVLVIANALLSGLDRQSLLGAFGVMYLGAFASRWASTPRFACPTCKGDSVVSRQSAKGARWAATFEGPRAVE
ncbi:MAG: hypothetical protein BroJett005_29970 [Ignavibacteriota bacterium]|nr:MAG: hypothetical protein BroJett005_29970 [Ignavibacteriota bacterium]